MQSNTGVRPGPSNDLKVGENSVSLACVLYAWRNGNSPESIQQQYPALDLEEIQGAIRWILEHPVDAEEYVRQQDALWKSARELSCQDEAAVVKRLKALMATK